MSFNTLRLIVVFAFVGVGFVASAVDSIDEPYVVYVSEDGSYARCGPSSEHYRTDKLSEGETLEVYLETDDGWLGVRPPESSFCWLPSDQVRLADNEVDGIITDVEAVAWIGTNLGRAKKYRWQVKLQKGEPVTVIGSTDRKNSDGNSEVWYRIVPPPGEFRWIHDTQIARSQEEFARMKKDRIAEKIALAAEQRRRRLEQPAEAPRASDPPPAPFDASEAHANVRKSGGEVVGSGVRQVSYEERSVTAPVNSRLNVNDDIRVRDIGFGKQQESQSDEVTSAWVHGDRSRNVSPSETIPQNYGRGLPPQPRTQSSNLNGSAAIPMPRADETSLLLKRMQIDFAQQMAAGASAQQVESLKTNAQLMISRAQDPVDRGRARLLVERIEKYQDIANQRPPVTASATQTQAPASFDRRGWLVQVYSARPDAPPFALTDRNGKTIAYISPAMGTNIRSHLNQEVGIVGRPNYHTGIDSPHFIAEQVVRLKR